jgi:N-glycosylase/DNA lyase
MTIHGTILEKACRFLLQKNLTLELGNKTHKEGKLIIFNQKNFYLSFIMNTSKKQKEKIEIPIPFAVEIHEDDDLVYFDYRIKTLAKLAPEIETHLILYPTKVAGNKFWDTILTINAN